MDYRISNFSNNVKDGLVGFALSEASNKIGKSYTFRSRGENDILISMITKKFIRRYDKDYKKHVQIMRDNPYIMNKFFVMVLDKYTFCYVATGSKIELTEIMRGNKSYYKTKEDNDIDMYLYIFGKNVSKYSKYLDFVVKKCTTINKEELGIYVVTKENGRYQEDENSPEISNGNFDVTYSKLPERDMDTVFFSNNEKENIISHIDSFLKSRTFYQKKQINFKTGILLHGNPGTGKSTLVKALATKYRRNIISIDIASIRSIDLNRLGASVTADNVEYIILLEDIDTLFLDRTNGESSKNDQAIINKLLQFLDSNTSPNNVIFVATTNHVERLDEALLREGRFDLKVNVKGISEEDAYIFGRSFHLTDDLIKEVLEEVGKDKDGNYNQSKLQAYFLVKLGNSNLLETLEEV